MLNIKSVKFKLLCWIYQCVDDGYCYYPLCLIATRSWNLQRQVRLCELEYLDLTDIATGRRHINQLGASPSQSQSVSAKILAINQVWSNFKPKTSCISGGGRVRLASCFLHTLDLFLQAEAGLESRLRSNWLMKLLETAETGGSINWMITLYTPS